MLVADQIKLRIHSLGERLKSDFVRSGKHSGSKCGTSSEDGYKVRGSNTILQLLGDDFCPHGHDGICFLHTGKSDTGSHRSIHPEFESHSVNIFHFDRFVEIEVLAQAGNKHI